MRKALPFLFITLLLVRVWIWFSENDPLGSVTEGTTAAVAEEVQVTIGSSGAQPRAVSVRAGSEVEWINEGDQARTLQTANGQLDSPEIAPGEDFEWTAAASPMRRP